MCLRQRRRFFIRAQEVASLLLSVTCAATFEPNHVSAKEFTPRSLTSCAAFTSNDMLDDIFSALETAHPHIARKMVIGTSHEGREIHGLRVSAEVDVEEVEPEARIIGGIHGNECMAVEVVLSVAEWLVSEYEADEAATRLVDNADIVFVPLLNPDGYTKKIASRENAAGVDLNRNLHFAWTGGGTSPFSEPETRALRTLSQENSFNVGISYHTVACYVNAPWNYTPHHPPDETLLRTMGEAYVGDSGFEAVFGWDWYDIQGDVNDWSLGTCGAFDWTLELMSDLEMQWEINRDGVIALLSFLFQRIEGIVTDADTGDPVSARISVLPEGAPIFNDPDVGDYHRLLLPGEYDITAWAEGYRPRTVRDVKVKSGEVTIVDISLEPDSERNGYAFAVNGMSLPYRVSTSFYKTDSYLNETMAWNVLGEPDGLPYSLSGDSNDEAPHTSTELNRPVGSITLDMGEETPIKNIDGPDLRVVSAEGSDDAAAVLLATEQDGPFVETARGDGTFSVDIGESGFDSVRYVRVVDLSGAPFNDARSGYDLDAIVNLSMGRLVPDAGKEQVDSGPSSAPDTEADSGDTVTALSSGCGCDVAESRSSIITLLLHLL